MIAAILADAVACRAIHSWHEIGYDEYVVAHNDGSIMRLSRERVIDFCVGLAIGRNEIPDTTVL